MSRELTLIEKMRVEFEEREGLFYPLVDGSVGDAKTKDIGKYGHLWINFMQEAYLERYRSLVRFGLLQEKAVTVNEPINVGIVGRIHVGIVGRIHWWKKMRFFDIINN